MKKATSIALAASMLLFSSFAAEAAKAKKEKANKAVEKEWTVAVFLNGDNNLDPFGVEDEKEMSRVGSNEWMNIVTLFDRERGPATIDYIEKGKINKVKEMGELDMGDYKEFIKFAKFIKENYPAKHYAFSLWNHGSGWKNKNENAVTRGISYDDSSNNHITNNQLTMALKGATEVLGQNIDIVNFDACLMQMVEVCDACKGYAKYMVASEEVEPGKGTPWDDVLGSFKKDMDPKEMSKSWVDAYTKSYAKGGSQASYREVDSTQSAVDLDKIPALKDALNGFAKVVMSGNYAEKFQEALYKVQKYEYPENIDLLHFMDLIAPLTEKDASLKTAVEKVKKAAKDAILANGANGNCKNSQGLAIYLPYHYRFEAKYATLDWSKDTMWDDMIISLAKRQVINNLLKDVKAGKMDELSKFVKAAKKSPKNDLYRSALRELNYASATEKSVPAQAQAEFDRLMNELKEALKR
jgi:hypothetical protein